MIVALLQHRQCQVGMDRRGIEDSREAVPTGHFQRRSQRIEVVLELQQQRLGTGEQVVLCAHEIRIEVLVRSEDHRDLVLGLRVDGDARRRRRLIVADLPAARHVLIAGETFGVFGKRVATECADECGRHTLARAGDRLVETFAARAGVVAVRAHRFARARKALDEPGLVLDVAADDDDCGG